MSLQNSFRSAAKAANKAVGRAIKKYRNGLVTDEDDITGVLLGNLDSEFDKEIDGITWSCSILRHRKGIASEESRIGADMIIHVRLKTPILEYSKGVLVQAKRVEAGASMNRAAHNELIQQCDRMLDVTPSSFVFDYATKSMRCGSASKIAGSSNRNLYNACTWTAYRFFFELFRCPVGDPRLTSAKVRDLPVSNIVEIVGSGNQTEE